MTCGLFFVVPGWLDGWLAGAQINFIVWVQHVVNECRMWIGYAFISLFRCPHTHRCWFDGNANTARRPTTMATHSKFIIFKICITCCSRRQFKCETFSIHMFVELFVWKWFSATLLSSGWRECARRTIQMARKHCASSHKTLSNGFTLPLCCNASHEFLPSKIESSTNAYRNGECTPTVARTATMPHSIRICHFQFDGVFLNGTVHNQRRWKGWMDGWMVGCSEGSANRQTKDWLTVANWLSRFLNARSNEIV